MSAADYALLLQLVPGGATAALPAYERLAAAGRVDGFLLTDVEAGDPRFPLLAASGIPVVVAGRPEDGDCPFPWLETRHDEGMAAPVRHLVELGHHSIAFFGGREDFEHVKVRVGSWRATLAASGLPEGPVVHVSDDPAVAARKVLDAEPTAVVCASDVLALAVVVAAHDRGLRVPEDVSVTGFDDSPVAALVLARADLGAGRLRGVRRGGRERPAGRDRRRRGGRTTRRRRRSWSSAPRPRGAGGGRAGSR